MAASIAGLIYVFGQPFPEPERRRSVRGQARFRPEPAQLSLKDQQHSLGSDNGITVIYYPSSRASLGEGSLLRVL